MNDTDILLNDPGYRRRWLLSKALEGGVPLAKALQLAQAAEEFLMGTASRTTPSDWLKQLEGVRPIEERKELTSAPGTFDALSSVVSIDDVVRYLGESGETVVPETGDKFLINGSSSENVDELVTRANRIRTQQGLPRFALLSRASSDKTVERDKPAPAGKAASKRPPSARERAEWARQVLAFPE